MHLFFYRHYCNLYIRNKKDEKDEKNKVNNDVLSVSIYFNDFVYNESLIDNNEFPMVYESIDICIV